MIIWSIQYFCWICRINKKTVEKNIAEQLNIREFYSNLLPQEKVQELEKIMIDAALIVLPGTHYAYLENLGQVINILNSFLKET